MSLPNGRTINIIAIVTSALFAVQMFGGLIDRAAVMGGFIPARVYALAASGTQIDIPWLPVWITPLSATLIHGGVLHLAFNMVMLLFCGRQVESLLGRWPTILIYVVGAYASAAAQWLADPESVTPMIGASGAISALMGTYAVIYGQRAARPIGPIPAYAVRILWLAAAWIGLQLLVGLATGPDSAMGGVAIAAHIGGFIAGLLLTRPLLYRRFRWRPVD
ncbi:rhomboid family intramembrane serine protease [Sphingobium sp. CR28]|uniref:rhomboid family intramembrane serine protease n=1 Tax=Sphingobium sp. CR28 TaxID=3400272 RepID=UPI003FEFD082